MSLRLATLPSLLLFTVSCGMASGAAGEADSANAGAAGTASSGSGGSDEAGTGGGAGTKAGSGGSSAAGSGQAGTSDPGLGGTGGGAGTGGNPSPDFLCASDANADGVTSCEDNPDACGDEACLRPSPIDLNRACVVSLAGRPNDVQPWCAMAAEPGPTAALAYTAPDKGWLRVEVSSTRDVILSATKAGCEETAGLCLNQFGPGGLERLRLPVAKGETVTVLVTGATPSEDGEAQVTLRATLERPACGDSKVEGDEVCDDGNAEDGDFCSADCLQITGCDDAEALADDVEAPPQPSVGHGPLGPSAGALGSCVTVGAKVRRTIHALRAEATGRLEVELAPGSARDLALSVRTSCGAGAELGCSDSRGALAGAGGQERLSLPAVKGETYLLVVEGYGDEEGDYELRAQSLPSECGDGVVASSVEQCEPGGLDGACTDQCTRPVEGPGADAAAAVVLPAGGARARVWPAGDVDDYVVSVDKEAIVVVDRPGGEDDCALGRIDSQLTVLNDQGQVIAFNDDAPDQGHVAGRCSQARLPEAGTYLVRVRSSELAAPVQVFSYWLHVVGG